MLNQQADLFDPTVRFQVVASIARKRPRQHTLRTNPRQGPKVRAKRVVSEEDKAQRIKIAREVVEGGGSIGQFARTINLDVSWARKWLLIYAPDVYKQMVDQPHPITLSPAQRIARLEAVLLGQQMGLSIKQIASHLDMEPGGLTRWLNLWAADGVEDALDLESEDLREAA